MHNVALYLKPNSETVGRSRLVLFLFILDWIMTVIFAAFQIVTLYYLRNQQFDHRDIHNAAMQYLIGGVFSVILILAAFVDSYRYLRGCCSKMMYLLSCLMLKPLLLPILCPQIMFESYKSNTGYEVPLRKHVKKRPLGTFIQNNTTKFVLSAQEMNFIMSFSYSGLISIATCCNLVHEEKEGKIEQFIIMLKMYCIIYSTYSLLVTFFLYGRKAAKYDKEDQDEED